MTRRAYDLRKELRGVLRLELAIVGLSAVVAWLVAGSTAALAAAAGGGIALVNLLLLRWHSSRAERLDATDVRGNIKIFYRCALERFLAAAVLFALSIGVLKLPPLPLLGGFLAAQAAQLSLTLNSKRNRGWRNV